MAWLPSLQAASAFISTQGREIIDKCDPLENDPGNVMSLPASLDSLESLLPSSYSSMVDNEVETILKVRDITSIFFNGH